MKKDIKKYIVSAAVIAAAIGVVYIKMKEINPVNEVVKGIDGVMNNSDKEEDNAISSGDVVDYYMSLTPDDLTYTEPPAHTYDSDNKPKGYIMRNMYYGESDQMKKFDEEIDKEVIEQVRKHDLGDWAYEGDGARKGIYNKNNVLEGDKSFLNRHALTEFTITDMRILDKDDNLDELDDEYIINGDKASLKKLIINGTNKEVYHHMFAGPCTQEEGRADIRVLLVDMKIVCKSPWPVLLTHIPLLRYLDDDKEYMETAHVVYENEALFPERVCYTKPKLNEDLCNMCLVGKDEEVNVTAGFIIDVSMDNAYLVFDSGCNESGSYFSCDQHLVKVEH